MRTLIRVSLMAVVSLLLTIAFTSQQQAMAQTEDDVIINEFSVNSNSGREYVELLVTNSSGVNMQGWTLSDVATRAGATAGTEGDVTLPAAAYLANVPSGTHVVIVLTTATTAPQVLTEDTSTADGNNRLVLIVGVTAGLTTGGTMDNATADNLHLYAGTRAAGTLIDQVLVGNNASFIAGATWGDNSAATTTDNINAPAASMPSNSIARFVPTANTLAGFQDNDTGARWVVDANSYGTPGFRNAGVRSETSILGSSAPRPEIAQFNGDNMSDVSVWRSDEANWYYINSTTSELRVQIDWGRASLGDIAVPHNYNGNGTNIAIFRPSEGNWYVIDNVNTLPFIVNWGQSGDIPVPADYDGDNKADFAVFRPSEGNWYIRNIFGVTSLRSFGATGDIPVRGDFDNDRKADAALFRPSENNWYIQRSSGGITVTNWGLSGDELVPADYDGDGITDIAVFRPSEGNWYIRRSSGGVLVRNWGGSGDTPVPGDYDGDGLVDVAVYRGSEGNWYILRSSDNTGRLVFLPGSNPVPNEYLP